MICLRCKDIEAAPDYPVCTDCEPFAHFEYRTGCRCQNAVCTEKRLKALQFTETGHQHTDLQNGTAAKRKNTVVDYRTLKARKEALGFRIDDIQTRCGFSDITISKVLNGSENHEIDTYKRIAEALELEVVLTFRPKLVSAVSAAIFERRHL